MSAALVRYLPLVKHVAARVAAGIRSAIVDYDDLVQCGWLGLMDALGKFDPARHVKFTTYAVPRIRGAMLDGVRATDWQSRHMRLQARATEAAIGDLEAGLGRAATDAEIAGALGVALPELWRLRARIAYAAPIASLHDGCGEDGAPPEDHLAAPPSADPAAIAEREEVRRVILEAIEELPEDERLVLTLHHHEGMLLQEIAEVLAVTPGRVSQLRAKAYLALRAKLGAAGVA